MPLDARGLESVIHVGRHLRPQGTQPLFLVLRAVLAVLGQVPRRRLPLGAETGVLHPVNRQRVLGHAVPMLVNLQSLRVTQHLDVFPFAPRDPVVVPLHGDIAVFVRAPLQRPVRGGELGRQFAQVAAFVLECLGGNQARLARRAMLHADRGPLQRLPIEILQAGEAAARQEVGFHGPKTPLLARLAVRVANARGKGIQSRNNGRRRPFPAR